MDDKYRRAKELAAWKLLCANLCSWTVGACHTNECVSNPAVAAAVDQAVAAAVGPAVAAAVGPAVAAALGPAVAGAMAPLFNSIQKIMNGYMVYRSG
jgi:hypothetical protein